MTTMEWKKEEEEEKEKQRGGGEENERTLFFFLSLQEDISGIEEQRKKELPLKPIFGEKDSFLGAN